MAKVASLTLHKNKLEARRKKDVGRGISAGIAKKVRDADIRAYAFVGIDAGGKAHCLWDTGAIMPMWGFPSAVAVMLQDNMSSSGVDEDWKPALPARS